MNPPSPIAALRRLPPPLRLVALQAAVGVAAPSDITALAVEAIELALPRPDRAHAAAAQQALEVAVAWWDHLDPATRRLLVATGADRLPPALASLGRAADRATRDLAARIPCDLGDPGLAGHLSAMLADDAAGDAAARALMRLVIDLRPDLAPQPPRPQPAPRLAVLHEALAEAAWRYAEHRRRSVLLAVLLHLSSPARRLQSDPGLERIAGLLEQAAHPAGAGLRSALRSGTAPVVRSAAWRLLAHEQLAPAAIDRILRAATPEDHEALLGDAHLIMHPARLRRVRALRRKLAPPSGPLADEADNAPSRPAPLPSAAALGSLTPEARQGQVILLSSLGLDARDREARAEAFLADPEPEIRFAAMHRLGEPALLDFMLDADPRIARSASWRWSLAGAAPWHSGAGSAGAAERERLWRALLRSPHAPVRDAAADELARYGSHGASSPAGRILARRSAMRERPAMLAELRRAVLSGDECHRLEAIAMARALALVEEVEDELCTVLSNAPARVAASAAAALGDSPGERAMQALASALAHADARVQANALESLVRLARAGAGVDVTDAAITECKAATSPRLRANALRGLGERRGVQAASSGVLAMLGASDAGLRLSGAWVAERLMRRQPAFEWLEALRRLADRDADSAVRARAAVAVRRCTRRPAREVAA